jgi:hypothetical protein
MRWRRAGSRTGTILALAAGLVAVGAAPAMAADDTVVVRLPDSFTAGGSAGAVSVAVEKRTSGCTRVRTALAFRLSGLPADQVKVDVRDDGEWRALSITDAGDGLVVTERTTPPDRSYLCRRRDASVRYRVAFLEGAPAGRVTVVAEAYSAGGGLMDRDAGTSSLINRNPSPSAAAAASAGGLPSAPSAAAPSAAAAPSVDPDRSAFGLGTLVMLIGLAMIGFGIALLVILLRRSRAEPTEPGGYAYPDPLPYIPQTPSAAPPAPSVLPPSLAPPRPTASFADGESTLILPKPVD